MNIKDDLFARDGRVHYAAEFQSIDVVAFISAIAEHDFSLVMEGIANRFGIQYKAPQGTVLS